MFFSGKKYIICYAFSFLLLAAILFVGCEINNKNNVIKIGATTVPHGEILEKAKEILETKGLELKIIEFNDYVLPNVGVSDGSLDANFFQHKPYLDEFNHEHKTNILSVAKIHYEPFGIYPGKTKTLADIKNGAKIAVPNDATNESRSLYILQDAGLVKLKDENEFDFKLTKKDILENPKNLDIIELEPAQIPHSLLDVDFAVINGNYAIEAKLDVKKDSCFMEKVDSIAAEIYANIIAVKEDIAHSEKIGKLIDVLKSQEIKNFIVNRYNGAILPIE